MPLEQLHSELAGKIIGNKAEAKRLDEAVRHVEAVIKLLDPAFNLRRIAVRRRKPNPIFKRGGHPYHSQQAAQEHLHARRQQDETIR